MSCCCSWNSIWGATLFPFRTSDGEQVCPHMRLFSPRWVDPSEQLTASERAELWRHHRDGSDSLFHFHTAPDFICTDVQRIHWCMAFLSRSQLSELITAATKPSVSLASPSTPARSERVMSEWNTDHPSGQIFNYSMEIVLFLLKKYNSLHTISNSEALKKTRVRMKLHLMLHRHLYKLCSLILAVL